MKNKYEYIDIFALDDLDDVHIIIANELEKLESESDYIVLYAKRDLINDLFTDMICEDFKLGYVDFDMIDGELEDEVYLMLISGNYVIDIEPAYSNKKDIMTHDAKSAIIYMDECDQDIIDYCVESDKNVILFDFDVDEFLDEDECDCCGCDLDECVCREHKCNCQKEDKPVVTSKESYTINGKSVTKAEFDEKYKEIEEMYMDNIKDMLLRYCDFMDSMNELSKIFRW